MLPGLIRCGIVVNDRILAIGPLDDLPPIGIWIEPVAKFWNCHAADYAPSSSLVNTGMGRNGPTIPMSDLVLKSARLAYPNMESDRDDYAVMRDGKIVGRIVQVSLAGNEQRWACSFKRAGGDGYEMGQAASRKRPWLGEFSRGRDHGVAGYQEGKRHQAG